MVKKRVEESVSKQEEKESMGYEIDDTMEAMPMQEIPKKVREVQQEDYPEHRLSSKEPINCLRNEKVIVRFLPNPNAMVQNPRHILSGGMADSAFRSFVVPRLSSTGAFKNVLTNNEKAFLENIMGLEYNALSVHRKQNNFWDSSNPAGIGRIILHKQDNYLDLSDPIDYIKYKVLLANNDRVAASLQELEDRPKATYQFVIISENAEAQAALSKVDVKKKCWMAYGKIEEDKDTLRVIVELLEGRPTSPNVKLDYLQSKMDEYIQRNPRLFLSTLNDELLPTKVLIKKCVEAGLIGKKNDAYYLREDGRPLCEMNEESTLNNAAKYISSVKRQELKYSLEAKLKQQ